MAHEHPIDEDDVPAAVPPVTPPVPGPPPGLDDDGLEDEPPVPPAVMAPE